MIYIFNCHLTYFLETMQSVPCLHARVNVCSWIQQGIWYLQRLSSHKCYHPKRNLQVWSFLIDVLHSSKTYLRTSQSWLSCNGKINHSIKSAIWCLSDFDVLHRDRCCWNEHQRWAQILFNRLKTFILEELSRVLLNL